ncbi:hypothetical protein D9611_006552 [Ephemerocybe angulata]|uniref:Uncharacterized protein n=1 Tax=Ephemerocybe angulata TaxID=980116 RepID=A0A8H5C785_9AGAR|nr:hypothetical protein D9611_006552 [Tulosesus angulatus]
MAGKRSRAADDYQSASHEDDDVEEGCSSRPHASSSATTSPTKRVRRMVSFPKTPTTNRTSKSSSAFTTPGKKKSTTPYPLRAYDSPSNPFGRKHVQTLIRTLPPPTSFSKHLALRFQFVRKGIPNRKGSKGGGVHRTVQVPLSYTFVHLRCLISYLFGKGARRSVGMGGDEQDHLFEVKNEVEPYSASYKPGQIKNGVTWAKLSSTRDPCRWQQEEEEDELEEEVDEKEEEGKLLEEEHDDWEWQDEEDFTLLHVWPDGMDSESGIIYHHSRSTQVHIMVNTAKDKLPVRRGRGNTPHVFIAKGRVHLPPPPLPRVLFKTPSPRKPTNRSSLTKKKGKQPTPSAKKKKGTVPMKPSTALPEPEELTDTDAEGEVDVDAYTDFSDNHPFFLESAAHGDTKLGALDADADEDSETQCEDNYDEDEEDEEEEDFDAELDAERWNRPDAFAAYLLKYIGPLPPSKSKPFTLFSDDEDADLGYGDEELDDTLVCASDPTSDYIGGDAPSSPLVAVPPSSSSPQYRSTSMFPSSSPHKPSTRIFPSSPLKPLHPSTTTSSSPSKPPFPSFTSSSPQKPSLYLPSPSSSPRKPSFHPSSEFASSPIKPRLNTFPTEMPSPSLYSPSQFNRALFLKAKMKQTPAPPKTRVQRMRIERVERRIERSLRGSVLRLKRDAGSKGKGKEGEGEGDGGGEEEEEEKPWVAKGEHELSPGEVWDPFGDEVEV